MAAEAGPSSDSLDSATSSIKDAAKWILATFGAVGAAAFAGIAVSDIAGVTDVTSRVIAVAAAGVAAVGIGFAIIAASNVLTSGLVTVETLEDSDADVTLLAGSPTVAAFKANYNAAIIAQAQAHAALQAASASQRPAAANAFTVAKNELGALQGRLAPMLARGRYLRVRSSFHLARIGIVVGAGLTVVGAFIFVVATSTAPGAPVVGDTPTAVQVDLTPFGEKWATGVLGDSCPVDKPIAGTAIATEGVMVIVAVPATDDCVAAILRLPPSKAVVTNAG